MTFFDEKNKKPSLLLVDVSAKKRITTWVFKVRLE